MDLTGCLDCQGDADGNQLCGRCTDRLLGRLWDLPGLYEALEEHLEPGASGMGGSRRTQGPEASLPAVEDVLSQRGPGGMLGFLEDWAAALWSDMGQGERPVSGTFEERLASAIGTIRFNILFVTERWPVAGDLSREIREVHAAAESVVAPKPKAIRAGLCSTPVGDGGECGASLKYHPGDTEITCAWCRTVYTPTDWLPLYQSLNHLERKAS